MGLHRRPRPPAFSHTAVLPTQKHESPGCAGELAFDEGAGSVRAASVRAVAGLAPNPLAAPLLRALMPGLAPLLWDRALGVRVAMADLLLAVGYASTPYRIKVSTSVLCAMVPRLVPPCRVAR